MLKSTVKRRKLPQEERNGKRECSQRRNRLLVETMMELRVTGRARAFLKGGSTKIASIGNGPLARG